MVTGRAIIVEQAILQGAPIRAISYLEPHDPWDSGYAAWSSPPDTLGDSQLVHLGCFLEDHPEAGEGMDLARRHGEATRHRNHWKGRGGSTT
jgi:hypothetical protein